MWIHNIHLERFNKIVRKKDSVNLSLDVGERCHPFTDYVNSIRIEVKFIEILDAKELINTNKAE